MYIRFGHFFCYFVMRLKKGCGKMEIGTAIKLLELYLELNPFRHDMGTAVKRVLVEIGRLNQEVAELHLAINGYLEEMRCME